jgi:predicted HAD superfamily Cof-like phosphohydrolase
MNPERLEVTARVERAKHEHPSDKYEPQKDVAGMMKLFGQATRPLPDMIANPKERLLAANLIFEETLEFVKAMGFYVSHYGEDIILKPSVMYEPDLIEAADAIGDILVTTYGAANRLGVNASQVFKEVDRSNNTKVWEDGTIHRRESDGKVIKPPTYSPADIAGVLCKQEPLEFSYIPETVQ